MHGNVAEWCLSTLQSVSLQRADGRDDPGYRRAEGRPRRLVERHARHATSAARWRYEPYKPVYNVGFRVVFPAQPQIVITAARDKRALD